jgi:hypothetical protein
MTLSNKKNNRVMLKSVHKNSGIYSHTTRKCTITLDDDLIKKLHEIQAKLIKESQKAVSFSSVLNDTLRKSLEP